MPLFDLFSYLRRNFAIQFIAQGMEEQSATRPDSSMDAPAVYWNISLIERLLPSDYVRIGRVD